MSKKYFLISILFVGAPALSHFKPMEIPSDQKPLSISLQTEFFRSQANYLQFGNYVDLDSENSFLSVLIRPKVSYSPLRHLISLNVFMENFYAQSQTKTKNYELGFKPSLIGGGTDFHHKIQNFFIGLSVLGAYPLYKNFQNPEEIIVGDGAYYGEAALSFLFMLSKNFHLYSRKAFRYRGSGLSSLALWNAGAVLDSKYISTGASMDSFFSLLIPDRFSQTPKTRWNQLKTANAGSHKFYSVNPSVLSFTGWIDFHYNFMKTSLYFNLDTLGQNYAKGLSLGLIIKGKWNTASKRPFFEKKKKQYFEFGEWSQKSPVRKSRKKEDPSYFEEEEDPYSNDESDKINLELREELNLLTED